MRNRPATLVVIEFGASYPRWLHPAHSGDIAIVAQHYEGSPTDLVTQVANRITRLTNAGWQLDAVVLASNGKVDPDASATRSVLARGLMANLRAAGGCHLTLTLSDSLGRRATHSLTTLAAALEPTARACDMVLSVRVGEGEPVYSRPPRSKPLAQVG